MCFYHVLLPLFQHQYRCATPLAHMFSQNSGLKKQTRLVFLYVAGGDDWKLVAEKLGLNPSEVRFLDNRTLNPADAALSYIAHQRLLTVGNLYDVLASCNLPLIADDL